MKVQKQNGMAVATAAVVMQWDVDGNNPDRQFICKSLENALANARLQQRGGTSVTATDLVTEVRCDITYGPVVGCFERRLRRHLKDMAKELGAQRVAIFGFARTPLNTIKDYEEALATLADDVDDVALSLPIREQLAKTINDLRARMAALPTEQQADAMGARS